MPKAAQRPSGRGRSQAPGLAEPLLAGPRWQAQLSSPGAPKRYLTLRVGTGHHPQRALGIMQLFSNPGGAAVAQTRDFT